MWSLATVLVCLGVPTAPPAARLQEFSTERPWSSQPAPGAQSGASGSDSVHFFVVLYRIGPAYLKDVPPQRQPGFEEHGRYQEQLFAEGTSVVAGPLGDDPERNQLSGAILILRAASLDEARRIAIGEPALATGLLELVEVRRFLPAIGSLPRGAPPSRSSPETRRP